jgi:hypothetical protein
MVIHLLDQERQSMRLGFRVARLHLRHQALSLCSDHHRLQRLDVVGERIGGNHRQ